MRTVTPWDSCRPLRSATCRPGVRGIRAGGIRVTAAHGVAQTLETTAAAAGQPCQPTAGRFLSSRLGLGSGWRTSSWRSTGRLVLLISEIDHFGWFLLGNLVCLRRGNFAVLNLSFTWFRIILVGVEYKKSNHPTSDEHTDHQHDEKNLGCAAGRFPLLPRHRDRDELRSRSLGHNVRIMPTGVLWRVTASGHAKGFLVEHQMVFFRFVMIRFVVFVS